MSALQDGNPSLSVLLLCWNHERYLEHCIRSLSEQTSRQVEVVFLDNCSTDRSAELAEELLARAGIRHKILTNDAPANISTNINRLFAASSADLVSFLSTDDWLAPRYVEAMTAAAAAYPNAGLFYAGGWTHDEATGELEPVSTEKHRSGDLFLPLLRREDPIFFVGTCCRRSAFEAVGGFDEQLRIDDLDFFVRIAERHSIRRVDEQLVIYRRSADAVSSNIPWMVKGWEQFYAKHRHAVGVDMDRWMAETYRGYAAIAIDRKDWKLAGRLLLKALVQRPLSPAGWRTASYLARALIARRS